MSAKRAAQFERAIVRYDRHNGAGTGIQRTLVLVEGHDPFGWRGMLKKLGADFTVWNMVDFWSGVDWRDDLPLNATRTDNTAALSGLPVSAALFVQKLHRESKVLAIAARGSKTYKQLTAEDRRWRERDADGRLPGEHLADVEGRTRRAGQQSQISKLVRRANAGDDAARREVVRLVRLSQAARIS